MSDLEFQAVKVPPLEEVSNLILSNWQRPCWNYNSTLLQTHLMRPTAKDYISVAMLETESNTLASYQAFIPFDIEYFGQKLKAAFASFLTVSKEFQGRGLAGKQQTYLIEQAIESNHDVYLTICESGAASNWSVAKTLDKKGIQVHLLNTLTYHASPSAFLEKSLPEKESIYVEEFTKDHIEKLKSIIDQFGKGSDLKKNIASDDIEFLFVNRPLSQTFVYIINGQIKGLINFILIEVLEKKGLHKNLYFENIYLGELTKEERVNFLGTIFKKLKGKYHTAFLPCNGLQDMELFKHFKFREAPRKLNLYMAELKPGVVRNGIKPIDNFFIDVY